MPPRRAPDADTAIAALIAQQMAAILPTLVNQLNQAQAQANQGNNAPPCNFKHFNSCHPPRFEGNEGATGLLQWFEGIENTFTISDCPDELRVRYAGSVLQKRALTWWNSEKRTRGIDAALALPWEEFKRIMTEEFCPRNEIKKLEDEFYHLAQKSGDNLGYTTRFHELSILIPHMVTPLSRAIEKYVGGLPLPIKDTVMGSRPQSVEEAVRLAAALTDNHVKAGTLTRSDNTNPQLKPTSPHSTEETPIEPPSGSETHHLKRKATSYANAIPAIPIRQMTPDGRVKKPYLGTQPLCRTCQLHHPTTVPCRQCTSCGQYGHYQNRCHSTQQPKQPKQPQPLATTGPNQNQGRACYECGDPNHFKNQCPELMIVNQGARGRAFNINARGTQENNDNL